MPLLKVTQVVSFSSEVEPHSAANVLTTDKATCWRGNAGSKNEIVLQLEKAAVIDQIDIGNYGTALLEIQVGRSVWEASAKLETLLPTTKLMDPDDSRSWKNLQSVRLFESSAFKPDIAKQKWDRIRLICSNPWNKTEPFGLTFCSCSSPPEKSSSPSGSPNGPVPEHALPSIAGFKLKPKATSLARQATASGKMFLQKSQGSGLLQAALAQEVKPAASVDEVKAKEAEQWAKAEAAKPKTTPAPPSTSPRGAADAPKPTKPTPAATARPSDKNKDKGASTADAGGKRKLPAFLMKGKAAGAATASSVKREKPAAAGSSSGGAKRDGSPGSSDSDGSFGLKSRPSTKPTASKEDAKPPAKEIKKPLDTKAAKTSPPSDVGPSSSKAGSKKPDPKPAKREASTRPEKSKPEKSSKRKRGGTPDFGSLMSDVVFVLSGFQNPERGEIRQKALDMGATYQPDWNSKATHLITAFERTPKAAQATGTGGTIVKKDWIEQCFKQRKLLSVSKFQFSKPLPVGSDDDEDERSMSDDESSDEEDLDLDAFDSDDSFLPDVKVAKRKPRAPRTASEHAKKRLAHVAEMDNSDDDDADFGYGGGAPSLKHKRTSKPGTSDHFDSETQDDEDEDAKGPSKKRARTETDKKTDKPNKAEDKPAPSLARGVSLLDLPEFMADVRALFFEIDPDSDTFKHARRLLVHNGAKICPYMDNKVTHVISTKSWDGDFDQAKEDLPHLQFVKPAWVDACHTAQKMVPTGPYAIKPR